MIPGKLYHYGTVPLRFVFRFICSELILTCLDYITAANVIDHTTLVIPVTRADRAVDKPDPNYVPVGETDAKNWAACAYPSLESVVSSDRELIPQ